MMYFYQHCEGAIIEKPDMVVNAGGGPWEYFTGPFVKDWWHESDLLRPCRTAPPPQMEEEYAVEEDGPGLDGTEPVAEDDAPEAGSGGSGG